MMTPLPTPVPSVTRTLSEYSFPAPYFASPSAAALASLRMKVFFPVYFSTRAPSGTFAHPKFDQLTTVPLALSMTPGEPIPIA